MTKSQHRGREKRRRWPPTGGGRSHPELFARSRRARPAGSAGGTGKVSAHGGRSAGPRKTRRRGQRHSTAAGREQNKMAARTFLPVTTRHASGLNPIGESAAERVRYRVICASVRGRETSAPGTDEKSPGGPEKAASADFHQTKPTLLCSCKVAP